ncbi:hypothetical protein [Brevundimonas sp.]|uniref:hypothetical protein n=1 Tax=Brevundimonas sp. TaxID=1871086 RepID=UPI002B8F47CE|nr:hypothetical protein [Brevundimonas sp.]HWQ88036.1 hypothetical protein [Brevundimonas sp.]
MDRSFRPWAWSTGGLVVGLAAMAGTAWLVARLGHNIGEISRSIIVSTYPDEVIPRLLIAVVFVWGSCLLWRSGTHRQVLAAAAACAGIGILVAIYVIVRAEIGFAQTFPNDGAAGGWAPGAARAQVLPLSYLVASVQAVFGLLASTALLGIHALRRSPT